LKRWEIGVNNAKSDIFMMLSTEKAGPNYIHFPFELDEAYFKELYSEKKVDGKFKKLGSRRNEALDTMGYNLAAYYICLKNYSMEARMKTITDSIGESEAVEPEDVDSTWTEQTAVASPVVPALPHSVPLPTPIQKKKPLYQIPNPAMYGKVW